MKFAADVRKAIIEKNKTLSIAIESTKATEDGLDPDHHKGELKERFRFTEKARFQASYLDIFVEDAIFHLSERAKQFYWSAGICIFLAVCVLVCGIIIVLASNDNFFPGKVNSSVALSPNQTINSPADLTLNQLIMKLFSALAIAGLVLVAAKGLLSLIRAFLHEATRLLERRHALRFGKLYFYLKLGAKNEAFDFPLDHIFEAFQWNKETSTAFLDMKPDVIADTMLNQLARTPTSIVEKVIEEYRKKEAPNEKDNKPKL